MKININDVTNLKKIMVKKGISVQELSKLTEISSAHLSQVIRNIKSPSPISAKKITEALNVEFDDIFHIK